MVHFAVTAFIKFRGPQALKDNLQARGTAKHRVSRSKSHKTSHIVGLVVGWEKHSLASNGPGPTAYLFIGPMRGREVAPCQFFAVGLV
jgi:hypothetical protein